MITYSDYKRFYAESGLFTLNGVDYTGYVEVLSGVPYTAASLATASKCNTLSAPVGISLERLSTYETDLLCSDFFFDRSINDIVELPISLEEILIEANDFLNYNLLESKLAKIKTNTTYTYSRCFMTGALLPVSDNVKYAGALSATQTTLNLFTSGSYSTLPFGSTNNFFNLDGIRGFAPVNYLEDDSKAVIFAFTSTNLISLSCSDQSIGVIEISPYYQTQVTENTLPFFNIGGIATIGKFLYVTDTGNNNILKYDIGGYIDGDTVLSNKRNLVEIIGGRGLAVDGVLFNEPKEITAGNNYIAVNDSKNYVIKVFDLDFNFIAVINSINFKREALAALEYNRLTNYLYVLTYSQQKTKLYIINDCFNVEESYELPFILQSGEVVNNISFSYNNSNFFYISTNYAIYKLLVNKPGDKKGIYQTNKLFSNIKTPASQVTATYVISGAQTTIVQDANSLWNYVDTYYNNATFNWETNTPSITSILTQGSPSQNTITTLPARYTTAVYSDEIAGYRLTPQSDNTDKVFFITNSRIYYFKEPNTYKSVLKLDNFDSYGANFTLNSNEYIQGSSLNKEFYKLIYDNINLKNNLVGRFTGAYNSLDIFVFTDYNYNIDLSQLLSDSIEEYYIHDNEKNITGVFNRVIRNIYDLQLKIIALTVTDKGDDIVPVYNTATGQSSNTLIIE